jgi:hypothetical protein
MDAVRVPDEQGDVRFHHDDFAHDCREHLVYREADWIEVHGEHCRDEWWECAVCGEYFTGRELG